jgi:hypothetical protein
MFVEQKDLRYLNRAIGVRYLLGRNAPLVKTLVQRGVVWHYDGVLTGDRRHWIVYRDHNGRRKAFDGGTYCEYGQRQLDALGEGLSGTVMQMMHVTIPRDEVSRMGKYKTRWIRQAIRERMEREHPEVYAAREVADLL